MDEQEYDPKQKRQRRFLQKTRNRQRWKRIVESQTFKDLWSTPTEYYEWMKRTLGKSSNHGKLCSCHMCGNPRKFFNEKTLQEQKFDERSKSYEENLS